MRGALYREADPVARGGGGDRPPLSPAGGATGPPGGPTGLSPLGWATGACRPLGGRQAPLFFFSRDFVANLKKKNYISALSPPIGRPGYIFEIFQNRHIFLKF